MTDPDTAIVADNRMNKLGLDPHALRDAIKKWLRTNGKSYRKFAQAVGVDRSGFGRFMKGQTQTVTPETALKYAKQIGRDVNDFYTDPAD